MDLFFLLFLHGQAFSAPTTALNFGPFECVAPVFAGRWVHILHWSFIITGPDFFLFDTVSVLFTDLVVVSVVTPLRHAARFLLVVLRKWISLEQIICGLMNLRHQIFLPLLRIH